MRMTSMVAGLAVAGVCVAGPALAVDATQVTRKFSASNENLAPGLDVGVGFGGYTGKLGNETGVGGLFNITANAQPWEYIGLEFGYEGQNIPIDDARVLGGNHIWRNNGSGLAKLGPFIDNKWHPFVGAGFGLSFLHASQGSRPIYGNDWQVEWPLAAGIEYRMGHLSAGVRGTYRLVGGEDLTTIPGTTDEAKGSLFNGNLTVGGRF
ncbi:hypothetical protein D7W79_31050 [Corallococcus exercitus]|uniref:Outer membrane protein beta-barrel domain-containing protein n=1 Tax=Corallococcus exercitus TaxID=2316736 RepID=A0A3A8HII2_9BACT|nr:hypothetical protein [Corallococcus exercitus]NOK38374.1 hypothetical protein [Corallococcus exercitus]RKG71162.1 hypothetical protein D7W79_31050 [Corallococcus exercitus]